MKKKALILTLAMTTALTLFSACGSSAASSEGALAKNATFAADTIAEEAAAAPADYDGFAMEEAMEYDDGSGAGGEVESPEVGKTGTQSTRKLITNVNISAETEALDSLVSTIEKKADALGGYLENCSVYDAGGSYSSESMAKQADITARIPASRLNEFLTVLEGNANITSRSRNVEDITLNYVDTKAHKEALEAEKESLLKLMDAAKDLDDILTIEARLTDVRYQLESIESKLRTYDNQVDYSTVYMTLREVRAYTAPHTATVSERIISGLSDSLVSVANGLTDFFVFFVTHLPQLIVFIIVVLIIVLIVRLIVKASAKSGEKRRKKAQEHLERQGMAPGKNPQTDKSKGGVPAQSIPGQAPVKGHPARDNEVPGAPGKPEKYANYDEKTAGGADKKTEENRSDE